MVNATHGVVVSVESVADEAGAEMLRRGGNATDAALATAFAQGVVDPIYCGIGGGFHGLFHDAVDRHHDDRDGGRASAGSSAPGHVAADRAAGARCGPSRATPTATATRRR